MQRTWLFFLAFLSLTSGTAWGEGSCLLKCVRWWIFSCASADVTCSGDLTCINGECGAIDARVSCRRSAHGNWSAIMDCGRLLPEGASGQWQISYRRPGEESFVALASAADPWGASRNTLTAPLDPDADYVIRVCPHRSTDQESTEESPLDLSAGVPDYLAPGFAVGTVLPERDGLKLMLLAFDSQEDRGAIQDALEKLLDVPAQRPAPFWFTIFWRDGRAEGIALAL